MEHLDGDSASVQDSITLAETSDVKKLDTDFQSTTHTESQPFRFLDLPKDIRVYFYRLHLVHRRGLVRLFDRKRPETYRFKRPNLGVNLLRVCHQIHMEASEILYGTNVFCLLPIKKLHGDDSCPSYDYVLPTSDRASSNKVLALMGKRNCALIRKVEVMLYDDTQLLVPNSNRPWTIASDIDRYHSMSEFLPNIDSATIFLDWCYHFGLIDLPTDECAANFYQSLLKLMPRARVVNFDLSGLDARSYNSEDSVTHSSVISQWWKNAFGSEPTHKQSHYWRREKFYEERFHDREIQHFETLADVGLESLVQGECYHASYHVKRCDAMDHGLEDDETASESRNTEDEFEEMYGEDYHYALEFCLECDELLCVDCGDCHLCEADGFPQYYDYSAGKMMVLMCPVSGDAFTDEEMDTDDEPDSSHRVDPNDEMDVDDRVAAGYQQATEQGVEKGKETDAEMAEVEDTDEGQDDSDDDSNSSDSEDCDFSNIESMPGWKPNHKITEYFFRVKGNNRKITEFFHPLKQSNGELSTSIPETTMVAG